MEAILYKRGIELKELFFYLEKQLEIASKSMNTPPPTQSDLDIEDAEYYEELNKNRTLIYIEDLFYDIRESKVTPNWYSVDLRFKVKELGMQIENITVEMPSNYFVTYNDITPYILMQMREEDIVQLKEYALSIEDYDMVIMIRDNFNI